MVLPDRIELSKRWKCFAKLLFLLTFYADRLSRCVAVPWRMASALHCGRSGSMRSYFFLDRAIEAGRHLVGVAGNNIALGGFPVMRVTQPSNIAWASVSPVLPDPPP